MYSCLIIQDAKLQSRIVTQNPLTTLLKSLMTSSISHVLNVRKDTLEMVMELAQNASRTDVLNVMKEDAVFVKESRFLLSKEIHV